MAHIALIFTFAGITDNLILFNLITPHAIHHTLPCNMPYMLLLYHMYIIFVRHTHPLGIKKSPAFMAASAHEHRAYCNSLVRQPFFLLLNNRTSQTEDPKGDTIELTKDASAWQNSRELGLVGCTTNLNIAPQILSCWQKQLKDNVDMPYRGLVNYTSDEAKEIASLQRELRDAKDTLNVLKKLSSLCTHDPCQLSQCPSRSRKYPQGRPSSFGVRGAF